MSEDSVPLAERLRPESPEAFAGQRHLLAPGKPLYAALRSGKLHSMLLWGPPGSGKTTLARLLAQANPERRFLQLSAVLTGIPQLREELKRAEREPTLIFIDEIHRFNRTQQDLLLPHVERGAVVLIGATTEHPASALTPALLSRLQVYRLKPLSEEELRSLLRRAERALSLTLTPEAERLLVEVAMGDGRRLFNLLETALAAGKELDGETVREALGEELCGASCGDLYDHLSVLQKSIRGSDPDAALYWFCRMVEGGCDPMLIARRLIVTASEDIGNADPRALTLALNAAEAYERLGPPEGELALAQAVVYLALAPKSNAVYRALKAAREDAKRTRHLEVPPYLRHPPRGRYRYPHDEPEGYAAGVRYFPQGIEPRQYYSPTDRGFEIKLKQKRAYLAALDGEGRLGPATRAEKRGEGD